MFISARTVSTSLTWIEWADVMSILMPSLSHILFYTHTHTHIHAQECTHTHMHTHMHAYTHTHTQALQWAPVYNKIYTNHFLNSLQLGIGMSAQHGALGEVFHEILCHWHIRQQHELLYHPTMSNIWNIIRRTSKFQNRINTLWQRLTHKEIEMFYKLKDG